jgi:hypothetical protein
MFSRLVLVGMVAALGITVPTRLEILGWIKAAHSWTASRLSDWDSARPSDDGVIVAPVLPWTPIERKPDAVTPLPTGILVAMSGGGTAAESLDYRPGPSLGPIVAGDRASGLAHELNRRAEGLDISIEPAMTGRRVAVGTTGPARSTGKPTDLAPPLAGDTVEERLAILWFRAVEGSDPTGTPVTLNATGRRSSVAIPPISCTFSGPSTVERPARQVMTTPFDTAFSLVASASRYDLITPLKRLTLGSLPRGETLTNPPFARGGKETGGPPTISPPYEGGGRGGWGPSYGYWGQTWLAVRASSALDDAVRGLAQKLNQFAEAIDGSGSGASVAVATRPSFVPIDPGPGLESGLAHELNRASEGLTIVQAAGVSEDSLKTGLLVRDGPTPEVSAEGEGGTPPDPPSDVGLALRLTREAAHAWMNVLSGSPAVRMSAR